jgi:hypothetical protein
MKYPFLIYKFHGYKKNQLPSLLIHNPGTQVSWEKSNNHAGSIMKPIGSLMRLK